MPEAICASVSPVSGRLCTGPALHPASKSMCGNGDERWWHPDSEEGRREARDRAATAARSLQREERERAASIHPHRSWLAILDDWANADDDRPLDLAGATVPPRVQMLLGRAFSDVAGLIGEWVSVEGMPVEGQPNGWSGDLVAVHRDATGAPYAIVVNQQAYYSVPEVQVTVPWHGVASLHPSKRPEPPATDPWKPPQPGDPDYQEPPF